MQNDGESLDVYYARLRRLACTGIDHASEIRAQIIPGYRSSLRKLILRQPGITLDEILILARSQELVDARAEDMAGALSRCIISTFDTKTVKIKTEQIDSIQRRPTRLRNSALNKRPTPNCSNCGQSHPPNDACPAQGKNCSRCGRVNHFAKVCRNGAPPRRSGYRGRGCKTLLQLSVDEESEPSARYHTKKGGWPQYEDDEDEEVFVVSYTSRPNQKKRPPPMCTVQIAGADVSALIDAGASVNILDIDQYQRLLPRPPITPTKARIYTYGGTEPIPLQGMIEVTVTNKGRAMRAQFHVTRKNSGTLLSCHTAEDLGLVF